MRRFFDHQRSRLCMITVRGELLYISNESTLKNHRPYLSSSYYVIWFITVKIHAAKNHFQNGNSLCEPLRYPGVQKLKIFPTIYYTVIDENSPQLTWKSLCTGLKLECAVEILLNWSFCEGSGRYDKNRSSSVLLMSDRKFFRREMLRSFHSSPAIF